MTVIKTPFAISTAHYGVVNGVLYLNNNMSDEKGYYFKKAAVFLNTAIDPRYKDSQLIRSILPVLLKHDYAFITFDTPGIGESQSSFKPLTFSSIYNHIEKGGFVPQTLEVLEELKNKYKMDSFLLMGVCGGGITAFHTSACTHIVNKIIILGMPVVLSVSTKNVSADIHFLKYRLMGLFRNGNFRRALKKLSRLRVKNSGLFLTYKMMKKVMFEYNSYDPYLTNGVNSEFLKSFNIIKQKDIPVLCIYGEDDRYYYNAYNELFKNNVELIKSEPTRNWGTVIIKSAKHNFYDINCQKMLQRTIDDFLRKHEDIQKVKHAYEL